MAWLHDEGRRVIRERHKPMNRMRMSLMSGDADHWLSSTSKNATLPLIQELSELSWSTKKQLLQNATLVRLEPGEPLHHAQSGIDELYLLQDGLVRLYRLSETGDEFTIGFAKAGEIIGDQGLFEDTPSEDFAVAMQHSVLVRLSARALKDALSESTGLSAIILAQIQSKNRYLSALAEDLVFRSAPSRLAKMILRLAWRFGEDGGDSTRVALRLTQSELATLIGSSRTTVNLTLTEFRLKGCIDIIDGHIHIENLIALSKIARMEDHE